MTKTLLTLAAIALTATSSTFAGEPRSTTAPATAAAHDGTTKEVRYVSNAGLRKGETVSKLIITRDASGKIISVKRG